MILYCLSHSSEAARILEILVGADFVGEISWPREAHKWWCYSEVIIDIIISIIIMNIIMMIIMSSSIVIIIIIAIIT